MVTLDYIIDIGMAKKEIDDENNISHTKKRPKLEESSGVSK